MKRVSSPDSSSRRKRHIYRRSWTHLPRQGGHLFAVHNPLHAAARLAALDGRLPSVGEVVFTQAIAPTPLRGLSAEHAFEQHPRATAAVDSPTRGLGKQS